MAKTFDTLAARTMTKASRARARARAAELITELRIGQLRAKAGKSQQELAESLGIKQPTLSKLEHQDDMHVSTLFRLVKALGGELQILARFPDRTVRLRPFKAARTPGAKRAS